MSRCGKLKDCGCGDPNHVDCGDPSCGTCYGPNVKCECGAEVNNMNLLGHVGCMGPKLQRIDAEHPYLIQPEPQTPTKEPPPGARSVLCAGGRCFLGEARAAERAQEGGPRYESGFQHHGGEVCDDETCIAHSRAEEGGEVRAAPIPTERIIIATLQTQLADQRRDYDLKVKRLMADQGAEHNRQEAEVEHLRTLLASQERQAVLRQGALEEALQGLLDHSRPCDCSTCRGEFANFHTAARAVLAARAPRTQ